MRLLSPPTIFSSRLLLPASVTALLLGAAGSAFALSLEAYETGTSTGLVTNWTTDWGSYDRDYKRGTMLKVIVRDVSRNVPSVDVDIYFIGRRQASGERFIYGYHHETVAFNGLIEVTGVIPSPKLDASVLRLNALNETYVTGSVTDGWIVTGKHAGRQFDLKASTPTMLELAKSGALEKLFVSYLGNRAAKVSRSSTPTPPPQTQAEQAPTAAAAVAPSRPLVPLERVTLRQPVEITFPYGSTVIRAGTSLQVLDQRGDRVKVRYLNGEHLIPIAATDLANR